MEQNLTRYSIIKEKNPREILLLIGSRCKWRKCRFCNYHLDYSKDEETCFKINNKELDKVTGAYGKLEIVNSGSFVDLDIKTMKKIKQVIKEKNIAQVHFECHWAHRDEIFKLKEEFKKIGVIVKTKIGVETFDYGFRENYLVKGIDTNDPKEIAKYFDEICLLQGLPGQSVEFMLKDIAIGLTYFERVCINIMEENGMPVKPDKKVIKNFIDEIYYIYKDEERVDILLSNIDFGIGMEGN